jgi:hypothetical protein
MMCSEPIEEKVQVAVALLRRRLIDARQDCYRSPDEARVSMMQALNAVSDFIESVSDLKDQLLSMIFANLAAGLSDLERGATPPLFRPKQLGAGRDVETYDRGTVKGSAAGVMAVLMLCGFRRKEAATVIADFILGSGFKLEGRRVLTWRTIANWRDQLNTVPHDDQGSAVIVYRNLLSHWQEQLRISKNERKAGEPDEASRSEIVQALLRGLAFQIANAHLQKNPPY